MIEWLKRNPREAPTIVLGQSAIPVVIRSHPRAKRMTLRLAPDGNEVRISIPTWGRSADALAFARERRDWLARQLAALPSLDAIVPGASLTYRGLHIVIAHEAGAARKPCLEDATILLGGPQSSLTGRLKRWMQAEAQRLSLLDLAEYCARIGKDRPRLALSHARRRWGSCSPDGTVRINWRLVMAPDFVRRSVVAHEAAHLVHFNHSADFHALLREIFEGDIRAANDWLKREGRSLYLPFG